MSETKFTPGPWKSEGPDEFGDYNIIPPDARLAVAAVVSNLRGAIEVYGNARLVSVAPELYEALKPFADLADMLDSGHYKWSDDMHIAKGLSVKSVRAAAAAFAKARGD